MVDLESVVVVSTLQGCFGGYNIRMCYSMSTLVSLEGRWSVVDYLFGE